MLTKQKLLESIQAMPEDKFEDIDVLLERIIILEKIENGVNDVKEGKHISSHEMKNVIDSWFTK